ncbi:hypothetical protein ACP26L_12810 [Paenibacillus sp. S-38]|uniref:hypothetical protein n=1 Tax=Paenibacillus sp. S-38 TaxID=3416710 RepID=UPI003CF48C50
MAAAEFISNARNVQEMRKVLQDGMTAWNTICHPFALPARRASSTPSSSSPNDSE